MIDPSVSLKETDQQLAWPTIFYSCWPNVVVNEMIVSFHSMHRLSMHHIELQFNVVVVIYLLIDRRQAHGRSKSNNNKKQTDQRLFHSFD